MIGYNYGLTKGLKRFQKIDSEKEEDDDEEEEEQEPVEDVTQLDCGDKHLCITDNHNGTFNVNIYKKGVFGSEKTILDMNVKKSAICGVLDSAVSMGYLDAESENLVLMKYEG
ncbi:MAG: hypothetical protein MJZ66_01665 [Bacteroidales bacterium]|nr:hypothetical protein [Bacteroidales bacterium]